MGIYIDELALVSNFSSGARLDFFSLKILYYGMWDGIV